MTPVILAVVVGLFLFAGSAMAEPRKEKEKPKPKAAPDDKVQSGDDFVKQIGTIAGGLAGLKGVAGVFGSIAKTIGEIAGALPPGLGPFIIAVAAYIFIKELTLLGQKSKDFSKRVGRAAYPTFGILHGLEVAFMREVFALGKYNVTESVTRDERLDTDFGEVKTIGEFVTFQCPDAWSQAEWKAFNKLVRKLTMQTLVTQSFLASAFNSNWKGMSGMGRPTKSISELGFSGKPVAQWRDVDLTQSIPYDSIPTPGGFYFSMAGGLANLAQTGDEGLSAKAACDGLVCGSMILRADPTWIVFRDDKEYAAKVFAWGEYARIGGTLRNHLAIFPANTYGSQTEFGVNLSREDAGTLVEWNGLVGTDNLFKDLESRSTEDERLWQEQNAKGNLESAKAKQAELEAAIARGELTAQGTAITAPNPIAPKNGAQIANQSGQTNTQTSSGYYNPDLGKIR